MGQSLTVIGYSSGLPEISEVEKLYQIQDLPHNDQLTPDTVLSFGGSIDDMAEVLSNGAAVRRCVLIQGK